MVNDMHIAFETISLDRQSDYLAILKKTPRVTSDYSFINLWGWADEYALKWAWRDELVWIRQNRPDPILWAPVGPWDKIDWQAEIHRIIDVPQVFTRVPQTLLEAWQRQLGDRIVFEEARGQWDYLYNVSDLIDLKGNRFHKKKNLLNQFRKKYDHQFLPLNAKIIVRVLELQDKWCQWRDCESVEMLAAENRVIVRILDNWNRLLNILGGTILADDEIIAFTVAERRSNEELLVHFEKGIVEYAGVYQAINQMFLSSTEGFLLVNREQDLDDEGLRKAKLSYNPTDYHRKYLVTIE